MSAKRTVIAVAAGVVLGVIATPSHEPKEVVHFKFIHGPTKYITKEVPGKTVTKPPIVMDWPESCNNALRYMKDSTHQANNVYNDTKVYFDYINKVQVSLLGDPISVSNVAQWLADHKEKVRTGVQNLTYDTSDMEAALDGCQKAIAKAEQDAQNAASRD